MNKTRKGILIASIFIVANLAGNSEAAQAITPASSEYVSAYEPGADPSTSGVVDKVCKVLVTVVAVSAWVTAVVRTGGILLTVSKEIVKYVTVPTIICQWL